MWFPYPLWPEEESSTKVSPGTDGPFTSKQWCKSFPASSYPVHVPGSFYLESICWTRSRSLPWQQQWKNEGCFPEVLPCCFSGNSAGIRVGKTTNRQVAQLLGNLVSSMDFSSCSFEVINSQEELKVSGVHFHMDSFTATHSYGTVVELENGSKCHQRKKG